MKLFKTMQKKRTIIFPATIFIIVGSLIMLENFLVIRGISINFVILQRKWFNQCAISDPYSSSGNNVL